MVPSNNRLLSVKEASESEDDGANAGRTLREQPAASSSSAPASTSNQKSHSLAQDSLPPFEWNDPLAPVSSSILQTVEPADTTHTHVPSISVSEGPGDNLGFDPSMASDSSFSDHGLGGDNDLDELDILLNMDEDPSKADQNQMTEAPVTAQPMAPPSLADDEPMSYELLSHTVDNFSLYGAGINGTTHDLANPHSNSNSNLNVGWHNSFTSSSSEAWQRMHFPFSSSLFATANGSSMVSMPFSAAMEVDSAGLGLELPYENSIGLGLPPRPAQRKNRTREPTPEATPQPAQDMTPECTPDSTEETAPQENTSAANNTTPTPLPTIVAPRRNNVSTGPAFVIFSCYPFLSSKTLWKLDHEDDASLLEQRGCLHVPKKPILDEMMKKYFLHVHPSVPLLNETDFWAMYNSPTPQTAPFGQMSLFVFQAMLFIVSPFVSPSTLAQLGFSSVPEARANFYRRAKTLFNLEEGRDDISTAQGALMLTYHLPNMKDRTNSFWMSTAIHFARSANAHRYYELDDPKHIFKMNTKPTITVQRRTIIKRLWWCCVLRDKVMSLGMRRPMLIGPADFDVARPGLNEHDTSDEINGKSVYPPATKRIISQVFAALCELAGILTGVLDVCYPASGTHPRSDRPAVAVAQDYVAKLDAWYETSAAQFQVAIARINNNSVEDQLVLSTNAAYIYYYIARASVYNYLSHVLATHPEAAAGSETTWGSPPAKVDESFRGVTKSLAELKRRDLVRYLPNTFVSMAILPFKWHVASVRVTGGSGKNSSKETDLTIYYAVFKGFGEIYEMTDSALQSVGTIQT